MKNNFQQLLEDEERSIDGHGLRQINNIESGIFQSLKVFRFIGDIFTMYFPHFARTVVGGANELPNNPPNTTSEFGSSQSNSEPKGPSQIKKDDLDQRIF